MIDKTEITTLCLRYNEMVFMHQDFRVIDSWVADGCDIERDILPWMQEAMNKWKDITTVNWFRKGAYRNRDARLERERVKALADARHLPPDEEELLKKMKRIAWMRKRGTSQYGQFRHQLEEYEAKHGRVEP